MGWCKVAGVTKEGRQEIIRRLDESQEMDENLLTDGLEATLLPEPSSPHGPDAVGVWIEGEHVGYIPRKIEAGQHRPPAGLRNCTAKISGGWDEGILFGVSLFWD